MTEPITDELDLDGFREHAELQRERFGVVFGDVGAHTLAIWSLKVAAELVAVTADRDRWEQRATDTAAQLHAAEKQLAEYAKTIDHQAAELVRHVGYGDDWFKRWQAGREVLRMAVQYGTLPATIRAQIGELLDATADRPAAVLPALPKDDRGATQAAEVAPCGCPVHHHRMRVTKHTRECSRRIGAAEFDASYKPEPADEPTPGAAHAEAKEAPAELCAVKHCHANAVTWGVCDVHFEAAPDAAPAVGPAATDGQVE